MSIILKQLNDHVIKPIKIRVDPRKIKAADIYPELYGNIFMVAPTNSGKSTLLAYLLEKMVGKKTRVVIFCSTFYNDPIWGEIRKNLEKKDINVEAYTSIKDGEGNHLKDLVDELREDAIAKEENDEIEPEEIIPTPEELLEQLRKNYGVQNYMDKEEPVKKVKKEKYIYPKVIVVFDDISSELRDPIYNTLLKQARHYEIRTITSSQYLKDLLPASRLQIRGWILFANLSNKQLEELHQSLALRLPFDAFLAIYKNATTITKNNHKPFLYFLPKHEEYRKGLSHKYIVPESIYNPEYKNDEQN